MAIADALLPEFDHEMTTTRKLLERVPEERRRHLSIAGGLPLLLLQGEAQASRRFRKVRGLNALGALAQAVTDRAATAMLATSSLRIMEVPLISALNPRSPRIRADGRRSDTNPLYTES